MQILTFFHSLLMIRWLLYNNESIDFWNDSTSSPRSMYLTGIANVSHYTLSVSVLRFAIHMNDFDFVPYMYFVHKTSSPALISFLYL